MTNTATFVGRGRKYGMVGVRFPTKEEAGSHAAKIIWNDKVHLLPIYKCRGSACLRKQRMIPLIEFEWVIAAIVSTDGENPEIVSRQNSLNWWAYGIDM